MSMRRTLLALFSLTVLACAIAPPTAGAATSKPPIDVEPPIYKATNFDRAPRGFKITPRQALALAKTAPKLDAIHRTHHPLHYVVDVWGVNHYEIFFTFHGKLIADQIVSADGHLGPT